MIKNKKGQAVFLGALMGIMALIVFILMYPVISTMVDYGVSQTNNVLAQFFIYLIPYFFFLMIIWSIIAFMRSE